jgi:hypothetical protein
MKFCVVEQQGSKYFHSIDEASKILGVTRRTFFEYLKQVKVEPWDRKLVRQKSYFSEEVLGRMWVLHRRFGRTGNGRATGVSENNVLKKGGPESKQLEAGSKPLSAEQKLAAQNSIAEILAKV